PQRRHGRPLRSSPAPVRPRAAPQAGQPRPKAKGRPKPPSSFAATARSITPAFFHDGRAPSWRLRRGRLVLASLPLLHRPGILALGGLVAINELDHRHRGVVAIAEAGLEDADVAAVALLVAGAKHVEQLLDHRDI